VRLRPEEYHEIRRAAELEDRTIADFMRVELVRLARRRLAQAPQPGENTQ
jgi:uncharacterized protein (DUF1778 family)